MPRALALCVLIVACASSPRAVQRPALSDQDIADIALLLKLEDTRVFDESTLSRLLVSKHPEVKRRAVVTVARVVNSRGGFLLEPLRQDASDDIVATVAFAYGQLKDATAVAWLGQVLSTTTSPGAVKFEAARALGKIRTPDARTALASYLANATVSSATPAVVGEALTSMGRFPDRADIAPITKWATASDAEIRWRAAWALFRPRNPAALPLLLKLTGDSSPDVRFWAARGLTPLPIPATAPGATEAPKREGLDPAVASARLRALLKDSDRRVRTEAVRALDDFDDDASFAAVLAALDDQDSWISVSAAEGMGRFTSRADQVKAKLSAIIADQSRPAALRTVATQQLNRLTPPPPPTDPPPVTAGRGQTGRQGGPPPNPLATLRTDAEYRAIVERWIVPAYNGAAKPRAIWMTPKGEIEMELHAADAPLGMEELVRLTESGAILGTPFSRLVPNFVAQQAGIKGANRLRDEVNRLGLTRGNLSWASSGLDTGRPGYTLGSTPQPHNEGDFTSLGRVIRGIEVVDRLELGDTVTAARLLR